MKLDTWLMFGPSFLLLVQKKRSKEKDAFFKEFFGKKPKTVDKIPRIAGWKNRPESRDFTHIFCEKGFLFK